MYSKKNEVRYHAMLFPGMIFLILFHLIPMVGIIMAFQNFQPAKGIFGSEWIGLENFRRIFLLPDSRQIIGNTVIIAVSKLVLGTIAAVVFALLLNECRNIVLKRIVQTSVYLPHFLSWVILAVMFSNLFSYTGVVNQVAGLFGAEPTMFLVSNKWFRPIMILGDVWKEFGYNSIVYVAAMTGIDPTLYEAGSIDGAARMQKILHITLPGILPTIVLMATLNMGQVLNAGFDQILNLYSPLVYETGDIIDTYVYRVGLLGLQYSFGTAVGLFKSVISFALLVISYRLADKFAGYRIF
ncbi:MAG: protein lplB [Clostridiales bacterium]|nr:sugar ABC transporter permease [Clostridiales bacterium]PWM41063.1 MAG: protein lplB [Clostridiales bacterium]